jgi:hypothetical protein
VLVRQPTGDELAATALKDRAARAQAQQIAADGLLRLRAALATTQAVNAADLRRLRRRAHALQRHAAPQGSWGGIAFLFVGEGDAPARVAAWAAMLVALVTILHMAIGGNSLADAGVLALSGLTSAGIGFVAAHASGVLLAFSIIESLLGDVLLALFIAAVVRRGVD